MVIPCGSAPDLFIQLLLLFSKACATPPLNLNILIFKDLFIKSCLRTEDGQYFGDKYRKFAGTLSVLFRQSRNQRKAREFKRQAGLKDKRG
jgi:hypothetical protein